MQSFHLIRLNIVVLTLSSLLLTACGRNGQASVDTEKRNTETHSGNENQGKTQELKLSDGQITSLNEVRAVNVNDLSPSFDFTFNPVNDLKITTQGPNSILTVGCEKNIAYQFSVYSVGANGQIDLSKSLGLGFSPTLLRGGQKYVVRIKLFLKQACLGLSFKFDVSEER